MKKRFASFLLVFVCLFSCLSLPAVAAEPDEADPNPSVLAEESDAAEAAEAEPLFYVALGDSITAGIGLADAAYQYGSYGMDMAPNFKGYSPDCYVSVVAEGLGLDRDHALNLGLPGLMSADLVDLLETGAMPQMNPLAGTYFIYPELLDYVRQADIVSIQIGANDATVPFTVSLGEATNWKSEQFANNLVTGAFRNLNSETFPVLVESLKQLALTKEERAALSYAIGDGMAQICQQAYESTTQNLPRIVAAIRQLNPDAQIVLLGYYNPVFLLPTWSNLFRNLNRYARQLSEEQGLIYVAIPWTITANDAHPTIRGHKYIGQQILKALGQ